VLKPSLFGFVASITSTSAGSEESFRSATMNLLRGVQFTSVKSREDWLTASHLVRNCHRAQTEVGAKGLVLMRQGGFVWSELKTGDSDFVVSEHQSVVRLSGNFN
jgi:hypothetical protein